MKTIFLYSMLVCVGASNFVHAMATHAPLSLTQSKTPVIDPVKSELLLSAASQGNVKSIRALFTGATIPDVNFQGSRGETALQFAAFNGHADAVHELLEQGADPDIRNNEGNSPLDLAAMQGAYAVIEELIASGKVDRFNFTTALPWAFDKQGFDAAVAAGDKAYEKNYAALNKKLLEAAQKNDLVALTALFDGIVQPDSNTRDALGKTPLMYAARHLNPKMIHFLLEHEANPGLQDDEGYTPLMEALVSTDKNRREVQRHCIVLLVRGSQLASGYHHLNAQTKKMKFTPLMLAVLNGNKYAADLFTWLKPQWIDLNLQNKDGMTALMLAAQEHQVGMVRDLLAAGADATIRDNAGDTALDYADGDLEMLNLLAPSKETTAKLEELRKPIRLITSRGVEEL